MQENNKKDRYIIVILAIMGIFALAYIFGKFDGGGMLLMFLLAAALIVFAIYMLRLSAKNRSRIENEKIERNKKYQSSISGTIQHFEGLPIPRGAFINLCYGNDKITFIKEHQEISLDLTKIIDMDIVSGNDIQAQATGAIAGGLLLGGIGGVALGALVLSKSYFVISYKSDNESKSIIFDTSGGEMSGDKLDIFKMMNDFKSKHSRETENIEL